MSELKLNLGACDTKYKDFLSVDKTPGPNVDVVADLAKQWPWDDNSVKQVIANHIFEHLPSKIHTMNELWRVLQPNGYALITLPHALSAGAFQDPTHVSYWTMNDFQYYEDNSIARSRFANSYGIIARFRIVQIGVSEVKDFYENVKIIKAVVRAAKE